VRRGLLGNVAAGDVGVWAMQQGLFDSQTERRLYRSLTSSWHTRVSNYPQIPVRKALGYDSLKRLPLSQRQKDYLLRTEFDFVVCDKTTVIPIVAVEFDGIGGGFAKDGRYITNVTPLNDPYRKRKIEAKLAACELSLFPLVVVSWEEIEPLTAARDSLTILDGIIGYILSLRQRHEKVAERMADLERADEHDPTGNEIGVHLDEIAFESDLETNPMAKAVVELQKRLPKYGVGHKMLRDRPGYIGSRRYLFTSSGFRTADISHVEVLGVNVYMRELNCGGLLAHALLQVIGEYMLYKTAWQRGYRHSMRGS
jgi:hypothetical protein